MNQHRVDEDVILIKQAFCEFFMKLLPSIPDPLQLIRQRWHNFRDILLDEYKSPKQIYEYVQQMSFGMAKKITEDNSTQQDAIEQPKPQLVPMRRFSEQQKLNIQIPLLQQQQTQNLFIKQPSKRKLFNNNYPENNEQFESIQKVDYQGLKKLPEEATPPKIESSMSRSIINSLQIKLVDIVSIIRKNGVTLACVYDKSFEINTSELEKDRDQKLAAFDVLAKQAQQDLLALQNVQRTMTLKGYSIYARKDKKDIGIVQNAIKIQQDEMQDGKVDKKKIYF